MNCRNWGLTAWTYFNISLMISTGLWESLLEIVESRCEKGSVIFCTQYEPDEWYDRINPDPNVESPISEAIMDRIIHNSYEVLIEGKVSMRERHGLKASLKGGRP